MMGMPDISGIVKSMEGMQELLPAVTTKLDELLKIEERQASALERIATVAEQYWYGPDGRP